MRRNDGLPILALTTVVTAAMVLGGVSLLRRAVGGGANVNVTASEAAPVLPAAHATYREAMADLDVGAARALAVSAEERALVEAFDAALSADTSAGRRLESLRRAKQPEVRRAALEMLGQHLLANGAWRAFVMLAHAEPGLLQDGSLTPGDLVLARALAVAPPERFVLAGGARVATDRVLTGSPRIVVRVNGRIHHLVLDTGASVSVLAADVARACGVAPIGAEAGEGAGAAGLSVAFRPAVIERLELGTEFVIENHPVAIVDPEALTLRVAGVPVVKLDGVIGWPVFRRVAVRMDPERGWTTFTRGGPRSAGGAPSASAAAPTAHRERRPRNLFWLGGPVVTLRDASGRRLNFSLETGVARSDIRAPQSVRGVVLHLDRHALCFDELTTSEGVTGASIWQPDGRLGYDIGARGAVTVDWPSGRLELER